MTDNSGGEGLKTIEKDGSAPDCRMRDARHVQDFVRRLIENDQKASRKRSLVAGVVDGNPPYNHRKLRDAGRADACNVNWGTGRSYLESGSGAFYDLSSQAPGFVSVETSHGNDEQRVQWSRIISAEIDKAFAADDDFDDDMQLSQNEMVLYGTGPLYFENEHQVFPIAVESADLKVPSKTRSKLKRWESDAIIYDYYPPELYEFIQKPDVAEKAGWDVEFTRKVIANAMDIRQPDGQSYGWEFYQNELKSNSLAYYDDTKICRIAHAFWREFNGRVTHAIVEREDNTGTSGDKEGSKEAKFGETSYQSDIKNRGSSYLFLKVGRYEDFKQCTHPMYFDRGRGGYHHTVTGLGVKLYGPIEYENRLMCNLMDKAFAPKTFFTPANAESKEKFQIAKFGDWGLLPAGTTAQQTPIQGFLTDGLAMFRTSSELMRTNLSAYRQPVEGDKPGNPVTKFEKQLQVSQESALSNTTFSRYYRQLDVLYREIVRRLCNLNSTDKRATDFQKACEDQGVPRECFGRIESVKAVRVLGEGSPFMRRQVVEGLSQVIARCGEDGQNNWLDDYIASHAGQAAVKRYNNRPTSSKLASDQRERAVNQVVGMKIGAPTTITSSQNALTFAGVFLEACVEALQSVQKGGNPKEVVAFVELAGAATAAHIKRMEADPLRKEVVGELEDQLKRVGKLHDQLKQKLEQQAQQQKLQQGKTQQAMSEVQIKQMKTKAELQLKAQKQQHSMTLKTAQVRQGLAINDARTASEIHRNNRLAAFKE